MSKQIDGSFASFIAAGAIPKYARVKLSGAETVDVAGLAEKEIGVAQNEAFAAGDEVTVKLRNAPGTFKMIAVEAIAAGAAVYTEAAGKVQDTAQATAFLVGNSLNAATADGDIIEVLPNVHGDTANA